MLATYGFTCPGAGLLGLDVCSEWSLKEKFHRTQNNGIYCTVVTEGTIPYQKSEQNLTTYKLKYSGAGLLDFEVFLARSTKTTYIKGSAQK